MADINFLPRRIDKAFSRSAVPESVKAMLVLHGNPEYTSYWDDFVGDSAGTWPADANWGYPATAGTGTEVIALGALEGGALVLTTGANANDSAGQGVGLHWKGDNGVYFAAKAKIDDITNAKFELGLTDSLADDAGAVATKATPTFTATDCAVLVLDTADDANVTFVSNGGTSDGNTDSTYTLANDTYFIVEVVVQNDTATGYINGQLVGSGNIEGGNLLTPWLYVETNTTATRTLTVDWALCISPKG
mgnify:CR=1 FL=1